MTKDNSKNRRYRKKKLRGLKKTLEEKALAETESIMNNRIKVYINNDKYNLSLSYGFYDCSKRIQKEISVKI